MAVAEDVRRTQAEHCQRVNAVIDRPPMILHRLKNSPPAFRSFIAQDSDAPLENFNLRRIQRNQRALLSIHSSDEQLLYRGIRGELFRFA